MADSYSVARLGAVASGARRTSIMAISSGMNSLQSRMNAFAKAATRTDEEGPPASKPQPSGGRSLAKNTMAAFKPTQGNDSLKKLQPPTQGKRQVGKAAPRLPTQQQRTPVSRTTSGDSMATVRTADCLSDSDSSLEEEKISEPKSRVVQGKASNKSHVTSTSTPRENKEDSSASTTLRQVQAAAKRTSFLALQSSVNLVKNRMGTFANPNATNDLLQRASSGGSSGTGVKKTSTTSTKLGNTGMPSLPSSQPRHPKSQTKSTAKGTRPGGGSRSTAAAAPVKSPATNESDTSLGGEFQKLTKRTSIFAMQAVGQVQSKWNAFAMPGASSVQEKEANQSANGKMAIVTKKTAAVAKNPALPKTTSRGKPSSNKTSTTKPKKKTTAGASLPALPARTVAVAPKPTRTPAPEMGELEKLNQQVQGLAKRTSILAMSGMNLFKSHIMGDASPNDKNDDKKDEEEEVEFNNDTEEENRPAPMILEDSDSSLTSYGDGDDDAFHKDFSLSSHEDDDDFAITSSVLDQVPAISSTNKKRAAQPRASARRSAIREMPDILEFSDNGEEEESDEEEQAPTKKAAATTMPKRQEAPAPAKASVNPFRKAFNGMVAQLSPLISPKKKVQVSSKKNASASKASSKPSLFAVPLPFGEDEDGDDGQDEVTFSSAKLESPSQEYIIAQTIEQQKKAMRDRLERHKKKSQDRKKRESDATTPDATKAPVGKKRGVSQKLDAIRAQAVRDSLQSQSEELLKLQAEFEFFEEDPTEQFDWFLEKINALRAEPHRFGFRDTYKAMPPVAFNATLAVAAKWHAEDMNERNYLSHTAQAPDPHGKLVNQRVLKTGYTWVSVAENISAQKKTQEEVFKAWFKSKLHRDNMMSDHSEIGLARSGGYWCLVIASPKLDTSARLKRGLNRMSIMMTQAFRPTASKEPAETAGKSKKTPAAAKTPARTNKRKSIMEMLF